MNCKLIAAAFAAMGLAACSPSPNVKPQGSASPAESTVTPAPAQPAAPVQLVESDKPAADQAAAPAAQEEKKEGATAPATEAK
ncbi:MAG: hypothetical protein HYU44_17590 [Betaproteobacteria bacterium]|nr:hypothetical protein [Betaproteobacteria bacterium]